MEIIKKLFAKKPCTVNDHLTFKTIPVLYPKGVIQVSDNEFVERAGGLKFWNVAVTTCEPGTSYGSFSEWMLAIQYERRLSIQVVADRKIKAALELMACYSRGIKQTEVKEFKNT